MQGVSTQQAQRHSLHCPHCHQQSIALDTKRVLAFDLEGAQPVMWYLATCGSCGHQGVVNDLEWTVSATPFEQIAHCQCACGYSRHFLAGEEDIKVVSQDGTLVCRPCAIVCLGELDREE